MQPFAFHKRIKSYDWSNLAVSFFYVDVSAFSVRENPHNRHRIMPLQNFRSFWSSMFMAYLNCLWNKKAVLRNLFEPVKRKVWNSHLRKDKRSYRPFHSFSTLCNTNRESFTNAESLWISIFRFHLEVIDGVCKA